MKKIFVMATVLGLSFVGLMAQNTFKGIVKYKIEAGGKEASAEIRVDGEKMFTKSPAFLGGMGTEYMLVDGLKTTQCINLSDLLGYLRNNGSEFTYQGSGKLIVKNESSATTFDSLYIVDTEPGHYYFEIVDGETKTVAGMTAYKLVRHIYDEEGMDHPMTMWCSKEIGPQYNLLFGGVKGMPLEYVVEQGDNTLTITATEVVKGKVKEADFLLPDGYETLSEEDLTELFEQLQEEIELLQED